MTENMITHFPIRYMSFSLQQQHAAQPIVKLTEVYCQAYSPHWPSVSWNHAIVTAYFLAGCRMSSLVRKSEKKKQFSQTK